LWALNQNDLLLLGSPSRIELNEAVLRSNFEAVRADLQSIALTDLYSVATLYLLEDEDLDTFAGGAALNTDSHPVLEFHAPRFIYANTSDENYAALTSLARKVPTPSLIQQLQEAAGAENHRHKAEMYLTSDSYGDAIPEFKLALAAAPDDVDAWHGLLQASRDVHARPQVARFVEELLNSHPSPAVNLAAAEFYSQESANDKAVALIEAALRQQPNSIPALEKLADIQIDRGNVEAPAVVDKLLAADPENARGLFHLASLRFYQQRFDEALQLVRRSLAKDPANPRARNLLAIVYGQTFQHDLADAEFRKCVADFPEDYLSLNNYGLYLLERGRPDEAIRIFIRAVDLNPDNIQAFVGLGEGYRQSGRAREAQRWYRAALRMDPDQPVAKQYIQ
jgi:tetratricopeptide (TPR) repeat protein